MSEDICCSLQRCHYLSVPAVNNDRLLGVKGIGSDFFGHFVQEPVDLRSLKMFIDRFLYYMRYGCSQDSELSVR